MKIIHCADLHLGSKLVSLPIGSVRDTRKKELLNSFNKMINYAKENDIKIIILSGDIFDSNRPYKKDKMFFYDSIKANKDITFLYLRGNHDIEESTIENLENLKMFNEEWAYYKFDTVTISGIELSPNNKTSLYSSLSLNKEDLNIVMMHGDINSKGKDYINLKKLANKNIDYLALGHIHMFNEYKIDNRGICVYPGCLDGRGFDELGEKGFVVLNIDSKISYKFIPFSSRLILEKRVDISKATNLYEAKTIIENEIKPFKSSSLLKIILTGKVEFDIATINEDIEEFLKNYFFYIKVYNELKIVIDEKEYKNDLSLRGEFFRNVSNNQSLNEEEKNEMILLGFKILNGEDN